MPKSVHEILQIDDLRLDLAARRVFRDEQEIELGRLTFDLFAALARAAPRALSTDDIVDQVWQAESVSDETVQQRVSLLRRALAQDAGREYVQTVRGFGYRLATEARRLDERSQSSESASPETAVPAATERRRTPRWLRIALAALGILALLLILTVLAMVVRQVKRWSPESFSLQLTPRGEADSTWTGDRDVLASGRASALVADRPDRELGISPPHFRHGISSSSYGPRMARAGIESIWSPDFRGSRASFEGWRLKRGNAAHLRVLEYKRIRKN